MIFVMYSVAYRSYICNTIEKNETMNNASFKFKCPVNEPILGYEPCSKERIALEKELKQLSESIMDIPLIIGGKEVRTGVTGKVVMPHKHSHVLATYHLASEKEIQMAVDAAL